MRTLEHLRSYFEGRKLIIPIILGLGVTFFMISRDFDLQSIINMRWSTYAVWWILMAVVMMMVRDLGYIIRLRILSDRLLSWKQSFQVTFLWEFASAITPGIIGGTAAAFVLLAQEKIGTGKSTAIVLATSFLDVLFYITTVPIVLLITGFNQHIPEISLASGTVDKQFIITYFVISYSILLVWAVFVYISLFVKPSWGKEVLRFVFRLPVLKKWKHESESWSEELVASSRELNAKGSKFWLSAYAATFFSWTARFAVVNLLILAFGPTLDHFEIYIRQLIMWCILLLPVTPGASGLAEALFPAFLGKYFSSMSLAKIGAILWRLLSYYPYLFLGFILFPVWVKRLIKRDREIKTSGGVQS